MRTNEYIFDVDDLKKKKEKKEKLPLSSDRAPVFKVKSFEKSSK